MHNSVGWSKANYLTGRPFCPKFISGGQISGRGMGGNKANDGGCSSNLMVLLRRSQDVKPSRSLMVYNGNMEMVVKGVKMLLMLSSDG